MRRSGVGGWRTALPMAGLLGACEVTEKKVDTVMVVDTVVRVDTVSRPIDSTGAATALQPEAGSSAAPLSLPAKGPLVETSPTSSSGASPADSAPTPQDLAYLRGRQLLVPVAGVRAADLPNTFDEARAGGARRHDALDIRAPRGTPVLSADVGRITKLFTSDAGGLTVYAADPSGRFVYYYAHLDRYDPRVREGMSVSRGDTIAYVGTTGNAPPGTPHLHFAVMKLGDPKRWWDGVAINPHPLLGGP